MSIINSKETEMSLLGSIMVTPSIFPRIYGTVKSEDFFYPIHRTIFNIMYQLHTSNMDINIVSVWNELQKRNIQDISHPELQEYLDYRVGVEVAQTFATQISEFAGYRQLQYELSELSLSLKDREKPLQSYIGELNSLTQRLATKGSKTKIKTGHDLLEAWFEMLDKEKGDYLLTGLHDQIDKHLIDLAPKELVLIAARPSVGKSALLLQSARLNMQAGKRVGFISMEMPESTLVHRAVSAVAKLDGTMIRKMSREERIRDRTLMAAAREVENFNWFVVDTGPFTQVTVTQMIREMVYEHGCDIVYVDYIQLISAEGHLLASNRNEQLSSISRGLKGLAMELNIPIVAAAQLNRESAKSLTARPNLSQLRDSGALEQDASLIIFLYPDTERLLSAGMMDIDMDEFLKEQDKVHIKLEVAKQRNGRNFVEDLVFNKPIGVFQEGAKSY